MATSLISDDCSRVGEANALFASEKGLLVLRPSGRCCSPYFTIPSGCYALVTRHGADLDYVKEDGTTSAVWPAGLHYPHPPWVDVANLVTKQSIVLDLPVKAVKTKDNVTVNVDVALSFRIMGDEELGEDPDLVRRFVYQVKPRGLEQQLRDAQDEAVRGLARSLKHTEIYGIRSGEVAVLTEDDDNENDDEVDLGRDETLEGTSDAVDRKAAKAATAKGVDVTEQMKDRLNKQFLPQGVQVLSVMIKSVQLPGDIQTQMTEKTMVISQNAQQRMYHQDAMQNTRMKEEVQTMMQTFHEQKEEEICAGAEAINAERVKLNDAMAQANKAEANIREETKVKIQKIVAGNAYAVQLIRDKTFADVAKIEADAKSYCAELYANARVETQNLLSKRQLQATKNKAQASRILAKAEGIISGWIKDKNEHISRLKELDVYKKLAENDDLIVSGSSDESENLLTVADAILQKRTEGDEGGASSRSAILAELVLLSKGSASILDSTSTNL